MKRIIGDGFVRDAIVGVHFMPRGSRSRFGAFIVGRRLRLEGGKMRRWNEFMIHVSRVYLLWVSGVFAT
jgi:hypothetical protein